MKKVLKAILAFMVVTIMSSTVMAVESPERDPNEEEPTAPPGETYVEVEAEPMNVEVFSPQTGEEGDPNNLYILVGGAILMIIGGFCLKKSN